MAKIHNEINWELVKFTGINILKDADLYVLYIIIIKLDH